MREVWLLTFKDLVFMIWNTTTREAVLTESKEGLLDAVSKHRAQIMGFAAMWIFIFHVRNEVTVFKGIPVIGNIDHFFVNIGFNGVDIFLFLSGWGLYHAINKHSLLVFYKRRYRRLILPFVIACLAGLAFSRWSFVRFIKALTCWTFLTENVNEPKWFIPAIAIYYLFFPLYRKLFDKFSNKYIFTGAVIALWTGASFVLPLITPRTDIYGVIGRIPVFVIGVLAGWYTFNGKKIKGPWIWIVFAVMLIAGFQMEYYVAFDKVNLINPAMSCALPGLMIGIPMCFIVGQVFALLDKALFIQKVYGFLGSITLEFYTVQETILGRVKEPIYYSGVYFNRHLLALIVFVLSLGAGYVLYLITTAVTKKMDGEPVFADTKK